MKEKLVDLFSFFQKMMLIVFDIIFKLFKSKKKYSMVIGVDEIANNIFLLQNIFDNSASVCLHNNKFYNNQYTYNIENGNKYIYYLKRLFYGPFLLAKLSNQSDIFFYIWWTGFCFDREIDYKFLKKKRKKIVCLFVGDDIRSRKLLMEKSKAENKDSFVFYDKYDIEANEPRVKKVASLSDKYADLTFYPRSSQTSYLKKSIDSFPYLINNDMLNHKKFELQKNQTIKILHAPSNPVLKGTPLVRAAIKKLENEGFIFEYIELINKSNEEVLRLLEESHIVLNQFYATMPGLFGIEAMAKKNAVLMSAKYEYLPTEGNQPWLYTEYWEVYDKLKFLLENKDLIKKFANKGFEFVKNHYTEYIVKEYYIKQFYENNIVDKKLYKELLNYGNK